MRKALIRVAVGDAGRVITQERLLSLSVVDKDGKSKDTATLTFDDAGGVIKMPNENDRVSIAIGWEDEGGPVEVFRGFVDGNPQTSLNSSGQTMTVKCTAVNPVGKAKERQQRTWKDKKVSEVLEDAAGVAGLEPPRIAKELAEIVLPHEVMDGESFLELGSRLADELGGFFKVMGDTPVFVGANEGLTASGKPLPVPQIVKGKNLRRDGLTITARQSRASHGAYVARYLDKKTGEIKEHKEEDPNSESKAVYNVSRQYLDEKLAAKGAKSAKAGAARLKGGGTIPALGSASFVAGGRVELVGVRAGVDGNYRIKTVTHRYSRSGGWWSTLRVDAPSAETGKDDRAPEENKK